MITRKIDKIVGTSGHTLVITSAALLGGLVALQPAHGQDSSSVTVDVSQCIRLGSEAERLSCFAAQVDAVLEQHDAAGVEEPVTATENAAAGQRRGSEDETSSAPERPDQRAAERRAAESRTVKARATEPRVSVQSPQSEPDATEYYGTVVALRERLPNSYVITLDNGQIWEQVEPKRYLLRPGLEVRIYSTRWGGRYRLSGADTGGHIQVRRLR